MKLRPQLPPSSTTTHHQPPTPQPSKLSDSTTTTTTTTTTGGTLTLTLTLTTSHLPLTSLQPPQTSDVKLLAVHNHHLYTTTGNLIHVINTSHFTPIDTFTVAGASSGSVKSIAFTNGNIFTSHQDNKIRVWKLTENKRHKRIATLPTVSDRLLRSISPKNYVIVRRHRRKLWIEHNDAVSGLAVINNQLMCSVSWDKCLKIWMTSDFRCVQSIKAHDDAINAVVVSPDGVIFTGAGDGGIKVWVKVLTKYVLLSTLEKHKSAVNALALNDVGSVLFSGGCDRAVLVWEKEHGSNGMVVSEVLRGHSKAVLCLINVCGLLFSGSADQTVRVSRRGCEGRFCCLRVLDGYERPVRSLVTDPGECGSEDDCKRYVRVFSESVNGAIRVITVKGLNIYDSMSIQV